MPRKLKFRAGRGRPELSIPQILAWADAQHARTGQWPHLHSGRIQGVLDETWRRVDGALRIGLRGLPGGSSLARLLDEQRGVRNLKNLPPLTIPQILKWVDAHHKRTGNWPIETSGPIPDAPGETWRAVDQALRVAVRGLPGGSSLAQLLEQKRKVRNLQRLPRLSNEQILAWADKHHRRTGIWPNCESGPVVDAPGESWSAIHAALLLGRRGLRGKSSLARLLAEHRGVRNPMQLPRLTVKQLLTWARAHRRRTGEWPTRSSGAIPEAPGETWSAIHAALTMGGRGLPAGMTLAELLIEKKVITKESNLPRLTIPQVLAWADAHFQRTGKWPHSRTGPIGDAPGETWRAVDHALHKNQRGLKCGLTLVQLLTEKRGVRTRQYPPSLSEKQILAWARAHYQRTGIWPNSKSGPIPEAPGETWRSVDTAVRQGSRGLPGGISLARLLAERRQVRNRTSLPALHVPQILAWAEAHHARTGSWPTSKSGPVVDAPGETWKGVDMAVRGGYRGLPGGVTLARLLAEKRGVRNRASLPPLTYTQILTWADAHYQRTGTWPNRSSGGIVDAPGETWNAVELALRHGHRGLPGGSSLARLLQKRHRI